MKNTQDINFWLIVGISNAIVIYLASLLFPTEVVLGNSSIPNFLAVILTSLVLTVILLSVKPVINSTHIKVKGSLAINITYALVNIIALWFLAKLALYIGFGVSSFIIPITLGLLLTIVQSVLGKILAGKK